MKVKIKPNYWIRYAGHVTLLPASFVREAVKRKILKIKDKETGEVVTRN